MYKTHTLLLLTFLSLSVAGPARADPIEVWLAKIPTPIEIKRQGITDLISVRDLTLAVPGTPHFCSLLYDDVIASRRAEMADLEVMVESVKLSPNLHRILGKIVPIASFGRINAETDRKIQEVLKICPPPPKREAKK